MLVRVLFLLAKIENPFPGRENVHLLASQQEAREAREAREKHRVKRPTKTALVYAPLYLHNNPVMVRR